MGCQMIINHSLIEALNYFLMAASVSSGIAFLMSIVVDAQSSVAKFWFTFFCFMVSLSVLWNMFEHYRVFTNV